jgi:hypothetical protein
MKVSFEIQTEEIDDLKMYVNGPQAFARLNSIDNALRNYVKYHLSEVDVVDSLELENFLNNIRKDIHEVMHDTGV